jgi:DNA repair protein RadC
MTTTTCPEIRPDNIQMTKAIVDIAAPLGISVHDHIIVGKNGHTSLKGMRLI